MKVGGIIGQMVFLVVDTYNYNLLVGLDFHMNIGTNVDVEKGVIQVRNGLGIEVKILPLNVVNMLQVLQQSEEGKDKMQRELFNMEMEQIQLNAWANLIRSSNPDGFNDDFVSNDEVME
jgi:hypothetical protein